MNIKDCLLRALQQFFDKEPSLQLDIYNQYRKEELGILRPIQDLNDPEFGISCSPDHDSLPQRDTPFYTWYAFNYAVFPKSEKWNTYMYTPGVSRIEGFSVQPVEYYPEGTLENAKNQWEVYAHDFVYGRRCIADTASEFAALQLQQMLVIITKFLRVQVIVEIKGGSVFNVLTNHNIEFVEICRDAVETRYGLDVCVDDITANATLGRFYESVEITDEEDLVVRKALEKNAL